MFNLQRTLSSGSLASQAIRSILSQTQQQPETTTRCVLLLLQQTQQSQFRFLSSKTGKISTSSKTSSQVDQVSGGATKGRSLPRYMVFRYAQQTSTGQHQSTASHSTLAYDLWNYDLTGDDEVIDLPIADTLASRPLILLFGWMLSRNSQLEKYRELWIKRGYDILTVQLSPRDLLMPTSGGKKVAQNVFSFLTKIQPRYDEVVIHAFSVGAYLFGELLGRMLDGLERNEPEAQQLFQSLKGVLFDSLVWTDDAAPGLSRAITHHPIGQPILEASVAAFLNLTKPYTYDRYKVLEAQLIENKHRVPTMFICSKDDIVSNVQTHFDVVDSMARKGIIAKTKCWDVSRHVLHYREHPQEYEQAIDAFVQQLDITKASQRSNI